MMNRECIDALHSLLIELESTRMTVCVDGSQEYQSGFSSGFALAQSVVEDLSRKYGQEVNNDHQA